MTWGINRRFDQKSRTIKRVGNGLNIILRKHTFKTVDFEKEYSEERYRK